MGQTLNGAGCLKQDQLLSTVPVTPQAPGETCTCIHYMVKKLTEKKTSKCFKNSFYVQLVTARAIYILQLLINNASLPVGDSCKLTWAVDRKPDTLKGFVVASDEKFTPLDDAAK